MRRRASSVVTHVSLAQLAHYANKPQNHASVNWPACAHCRRVRAERPALFLPNSLADELDSSCGVDRVEMEAKHTGSDGSWMEVRAWHHGQEDVKRVHYPYRVDWDNLGDDDDERLAWRSLVFFESELTFERA